METVAQTQTRLEAFVKDYCSQPSINLSVDLSPGSVLSELLIKLSAQLHNELKITAEVPSSIATVQAALDSTSDTYSPAIDAVASNYNVERDTGVTVSGTVKVSVAFQRSYYPGTNFQLIHPATGAVYATTRAYRAEVALSDSPGTGQLKLYKDAAGSFYFLLPVTALDTTSSAAAPHNSSLILNGANTTLDGFVEARAFGNFSSGRPVETDRELIARFQTGLSTKGLVSAQSMEALLPVAFPSLFTEGSNRKAILSVVGATDPELNRGRNATFGITPFGLGDVYIRTSKTIEVGTYTATATCLDAITWRVDLDSSISGFPTWFYDILTVSFTDTTGKVQTVSPVDVTFTAASNPANQLSGSSLITSADVARFSKYQVCSFLLVNPQYLINGAPEVGMTRSVQVAVTYMPSIGDIQDYMLQSSNRVVAADYLVKAVIPCVISTKIMVERGSSKLVDVAGIKKDIYTYVNELPFGESLAVSKLVDICHNYNVRRVDLPLKLHGSITVPTAEPTGRGQSLFASDLLIIPHNPTLLKYGVSPKTTMFFINYSDTSGRDTLNVATN